MVPHGLTKVTNQIVSAYTNHDWIQKRLDNLLKGTQPSLTSDRWLLESPAKRFIYAELYGDLLEQNNLRIIDVGGGLSLLSAALVHQHHYDLVDVLAHDEIEVARAVEKEWGRPFLHICDWNDIELTNHYDIVIANDLFPNVDQRLSSFLKKFLPICNEIRLSLTYYNNVRFYRTKRVDADEILYMLAWDGPQTLAALTKYFDLTLEEDNLFLRSSNDAPFTNGREVCIARLPGTRFV